MVLLQALLCMAWWSFEEIRSPLADIMVQMRRDLDDQSAKECTGLAKRAVTLASKLAKLAK
jgi:hypothetical protein